MSTSNFRGNNPRSLLALGIAITALTGLTIWKTDMGLTVCLVAGSLAIIVAFAMVISGGYSQPLFGLRSTTIMGLFGVAALATFGIGTTLQGKNWLPNFNLGTTHAVQTPINTTGWEESCIQNANSPNRQLCVTFNVSGQYTQATFDYAPVVTDTLEAQIRNFAFEDNPMEYLKNKVCDRLRWYHNHNRCPKIQIQWKR